MSPDPDPLAPPSAAAHLAPIIDRLRLAVARRTRQLSLAAGLTGRLGVGDSAAQLFMMMRNSFPNRGLTSEQLGTPFLYQLPGTAAALEAELRAGGLVEERADALLYLTEQGKELMRLLLATGTEAVSELWGTNTCRAAVLLPLVDRSLAAAAPTGGAGFTLMTPVHDTPDASAEAKLSERLAGLRFHRFDAHVAAWTAAGHTAQSIRALPAGSERQAIEDDTNRRAGTAYATLAPAERIVLLGGLGALSG